MSQIAAIEASKETEAGTLEIGVSNKQGLAEIESKMSIFDSGSGLHIWKDSSGSYRWVARYSNNFRDNDFPPEIIAGNSHKQFVDLVEAGKVDLPRMYIWHEPTLEIGAADWVAYDEKEGGQVFALAGGHFYPEYNDVAEKMAQVDVIGVSHGMPVNSLKRNSKDRTIIEGHITTEISPLPPDVAANKIAQFHVIEKEATMTISQDKKRRIAAEWNIEESRLDEIEAANSRDADKAADAEIEFKEETQDLNETETEEVEEVVAETTPEPEVEVESAQVDDVPLTAEDVGKAIGSVLKEQLDPVVKSMQTLVERIETLEMELAAAKASQQKMMTEKARLTPAASIAAIASSIIGRDDTRVDGREKLAKSKPKEAEKQVAGPTSHSFINSIIAEHSRQE